MKNKRSRIFASDDPWPLKPCMWSCTFSCVQIGGMAFTFLLDCEEYVLHQRLSLRGKESERIDDNLVAIGKKLTFFKNNTMPILKAIDDQGKLVWVCTWIHVCAHYYIHKWWMTTLCHINLSFLSSASNDFLPNLCMCFFTSSHALLY